MLPWIGPLLHHPRLGIVFFGLLIPVAQILFAAVAALLLRANMPAGRQHPDHKPHHLCAGVTRGLLPADGCWDALLCP